MLIWQLSDQPAIHKLAFSAFIVGYLFVLQQQIMPEEAWNYIAGSSTFMMIISKVPQIVTNFNSQSTGNLAFVTYFLNFAGIIARFATVIIESDDFMLHM